MSTPGPTVPGIVTDEPLESHDHSSAEQGGAVIEPTGEDGASSAVGIGDSVRNTGQMSVAIGSTAEARALESVSIGRSAVATGDGVVPASIAIGSQAEAMADNSIAIGPSVVVNTANVARIGGDQLVFGGSFGTAPDANLNSGELVVEMDEGSSAFQLRGKDSNGTVQTATVAW